MRCATSVVVVQTRVTTAPAASRSGTHATLSAANCDGSAGFRGDLYDASFGISCDVNSAGNTSLDDDRPTVLGRGDRLRDADIEQALQPVPEPSVARVTGGSNEDHVVAHLEHAVDPDTKL